MSFLALFLATAAVSADAATARAPVRLADNAAPTKESRITVTIAVRQVTKGKQRRVLVDFRFQNHGPRPRPLEKWVALDPAVDTGLLRIHKADGTPVGFLGRQSSRRVEPEDYVTLAPGESRVVKDVDITALYEWPSSADVLSVEYRAYSLWGKDMRLLQSSPVELKFEP